MQTIRILGSAALGIAYAGCGRLDFFTHMNLAPWDIAAGSLLITESGGLVGEVELWHWVETDEWELVQTTLQA